MKTNNDMTVFIILANTGFRYEYVTEVKAPTARVAREWFKKEYAGDWRITDFRVTKRIVEQ